MQFFHHLKTPYRKAMTPVTIMFIPHGMIRKTVNMNIPMVSIALLAFFTLIGALYICSLIPDVLRYQSMEEQYLDYSRKMSDFSATLVSLKKAEQQLHTLISPGVIEMIPERSSSPDRKAFHRMGVHQQIASSLQTIGDIKDYLRTQKGLHLAAPREDSLHPTRGKSHNEKRILFNIKAADVSKFDQIISKAAVKDKVDAVLIKAIIKTESNFNHEAVSPNGARGLMQLMPQTAHALQVEDSFHPENSIEGGARYLHYLLNLFDGDLQLALAAYNAGENAVIRYNNHIPPYRETQAYVQRVLDQLNSYRRIGQRIKRE